MDGFNDKIDRGSVNKMYVGNHIIKQKSNLNEGKAIKLANKYNLKLILHFFKKVKTKFGYKNHWRGKQLIKLTMF